MSWFGTFIVMGIALVMFFVWLSIQVAKAAEDDHQ